MTGPEALQAMREGYKVRRAIWDTDYLHIGFDEAGDILVLGSSTYPMRYAEETLYGDLPALTAYAKGIILVEFIEHDDWEVVE